ncbi:MAG: ester cyclase [Acidobacteria bacterium]|nr:ester cyclase [Acidobacteriota bacterium]
MEELFNQGKLAVADECCTRDYVHHGPQGVDSRGPQGLKDSVLSMRTVFPDLRFIVDEQTTTDDRVALRWTVSGTHSAEWMGVPATGRRITLRGVSTSSVAGGKLSETWANWDVLDALQQLGAAPAMAKGAAAAG